MRKQNQMRFGVNVRSKAKHETTNLRFWSRKSLSPQTQSAAPTWLEQIILPDDKHNKINLLFFRYSKFWQIILLVFKKFWKSEKFCQKIDIFSFFCQILMKMMKMQKMIKNRSKMGSKKVDFDPPPKNDQKRGSKMGSKMTFFSHFFRHERPDQGVPKKIDKKYGFFTTFWDFLDKRYLFLRVFRTQKVGFSVLGGFFAFFTF